MEKIGFIGGVDMPVIRAFLKGFQEGIKYVDPTVQVVIEYLSVSPDFSGFDKSLLCGDIARRLHC